MDDFKYLGYLKYKGNLVDDGLLDARKAANALNGFDETLRYFLCQENPIFNELEFEIPVKIQKGSWEALIPDNIDILLLKGAATWVASKYLGSALAEMAKKDFNGIGFKDLFKSAFKSITWIIKLATHVKSMKKNKFENVKFEDNNELIGIPNESGEFLFVPKKYYDLYLRCPENMFSKIVRQVEDGRELEIGLADDKENRATIVKRFKEIFVRADESEDNIIFPELKHNDHITLTGYVTRGNENSNTIGFQYSGHILTCKPLKGSIVDHKTELFSNCIIEGDIDRTDRDGRITEKKPRINFLSLTNNPIQKSDLKGLFD